MFCEARLRIVAGMNVAKPTARTKGSIAESRADRIKYSFEDESMKG